MIYVKDSRVADADINKKKDLERTHLKKSGAQAFLLYFELRMPRML